MINSMTGFGSVDGHENGVSYRVEIRSVNNRYFKAAVKLPDALASFETRIEQRLRQKLGRGSVTYSLTMRDGSPAASNAINVPVLQAYVDQLSRIDGRGTATAVDLSALLALPGVCQAPATDEAALEQYGALLDQLTDSAVAKLVEMRRLEGRALQADLVEHCNAIRERLKAVRQRAPGVVFEYQQKLRDRVSALLAVGELKLDQNDLLREVAIFAERCDVNEEISRLASHLDQFVSLCDVGEEAGRKLDFLAQELLREANTIGSKSNDIQIARLIVEIKASIDRIKEQVQNVA